MLMTSGSSISSMTKWRWGKNAEWYSNNEKSTEWQGMGVHLGRKYTRKDRASRAFPVANLLALHTQSSLPPLGLKKSFLSSTNCHSAFRTVRLRKPTKEAQHRQNIKWRANERNPGSVVGLTSGVKKRHASQDSSLVIPNIASKFSRSILHE